MSSTHVELPLPEQLLGLSDSHVVPLAPEAVLGDVRLHPLAADAFMVLREEAALEGIDLKVVSGFRGFERQLLIWNAKARGERALLDADERELDALSLSPEARVLAILRWSALPGASRHHWGSDFDVVDMAAVPPGRPPSLLVADYEDGGIQTRLGRWLDLNVDQGPQRGFFRPYDGSGAGVAREPWHLSYVPLSALCQTRVDAHRLREVLAGSGIELWEVLEDSLKDVLSRFTHVDATRYPLAWRHLCA